MLNKLFTFIVRASLTFGIGFIAAVAAKEGRVGGEIGYLLIASVIWISGGIYTLNKLNAPFRISALDNVDGKIDELIVTFPRKIVFQG